MGWTLKSHLFFHLKKSLPTSEWTFIFSTLIVMAAFVLIAKFNAIRSQSEIDKVEFQEEVCVTILGEVRRPGVYKVLVGTLLQDVVRKARPKKFSNLKDLPMKKIIEEPLTVVVEELAKISIRVTGEVENPTILKVKPRTRICDLKSIVILTDDADKTFFKRRKHLLDREVIEIPKKTVE